MSCIQSVLKYFQTCHNLRFTHLPETRTEGWGVADLHTPGGGSRPTTAARDLQEGGKGGSLTPPLESEAQEW